MVELFKDLPEVRRFLPVSASFNINDLEQFVFEAARKYIIPWVGNTIYTDLVTDHAAGNLNAEQAALLPYVQRPLACFAFDLYLPFAKLSVGGAGLQRTETDTHKSPFKYQEQDLEQRNKERAWDAFELMLAYLEEKNDVVIKDAVKWKNADGFVRNGALVINSAADFNEQYRTGQGRQLFEALRPLISDIEEFSLVPNIGQTYYNELKEEIAARDISEVNAKALKLIKKAVANFVIEQAVLKGMAHITAHGVFATEDSLSEALSPRKPANATISSAMQQQAKTFAERWLPRLIVLLKDNPSDYEAYTTWAAEQAALAEEQTIARNNDYRDIDALNFGSGSFWA
jgi:hypothetical protein